MARQLILFIKSSDQAVWAERKSACDKVLEQFVTQIPDLRLLCFIDDVDSEDLKHKIGESNRGLHLDIERNERAPLYEKIRLPGYVDSLLKDRLSGRSGFDLVIYIHGSTCEPEVSLIVTFSHELQHVLQFGNSQMLWLVDRLFYRIRGDLGFTKWEDHPTEQEAILTSKRVAIDICGLEAVNSYALSQVDWLTHPAAERDRWRYFLGLDATDSYDLGVQTKLIVEKHRSALERARVACSSFEPALRSIDFERGEWWKT